MQANDNIDLTKKPESLPAKEFNFPKYETITLKNGLKVFVIKDDQQPTINFKIMFNGGSLTEGAKAGIADLTTQIMTKGAAGKSALDIANLTDGLGISLSVSASADYNVLGGSGLKKHFATLLDLAKDVLTAPTFPEDEFPKLKKLMAAAIKQEKSRSSSVAASIARKAIYGLNHPYAKKNSEEVLETITINDLKAYYKANFLPNNATMTVVGDVDVKEVKKMLEEHFAKWEKGATLNIQVPNTDPMPVGVYFVERPTAVQSSIVVATPAIPRNHPDFETLNLSSSVIGAGFAGRLFKTLRETYSYTYTPFGYLTNTKYTNRFACGADVRGNVTDSSVMVILEQLRILASEAPSTEELDRLKKYEVGQYLMSFANKDFIGSLIQNADFYGLNIDKVKNYHLRMLEISPNQVTDAANKYMNPKSAYIVVVGKRDVLPGLEKFGKIYEFNADYEPVTGEKAKMEKVNMSAQELIDKYVKAIGGGDKVKSIQTLVTNGKVELEAQGQTLKGEMIEKSKAPNKNYKMLDLTMMKQSTFTNGKDAWVNINGEVTKLEGEELTKVLLTANIMNDTKLVELGFKCEILGKQKNTIVMKATKNNDETVYYFDADTYLISKKESTENMQGALIPVTETFSEWKEFGGIKFPTVSLIENPVYTIKSILDYKVNEAVEDSIFEKK
jgi:predicted Zn-dependent peptidase